MSERISRRNFIISIGCIVGGVTMEGIGAAVIIPNLYDQAMASRPQLQSNPDFLRIARTGLGLSLAFGGAGLNFIGIMRLASNIPDQTVEDGAPNQTYYLDGPW